MLMCANCNERFAKKGNVDMDICPWCGDDPLRLVEMDGVRVGSLVNVLDEKPKENTRPITQQLRLHQKDIHILLSIDEKIGIISAWVRFFGIIYVIGLVYYIYVLLRFLKLV